VRAEIEQYKPLIPTNANGTVATVSAWVMMFAGQRWAQMGWRQIRWGSGADGGRWNWDQHVYDDGTVHDGYYHLTAGLGTWTKYSLRREAAGPPGSGINWHFGMDNAVVNTINLGSWTPNAVHWSGETHAYDSQMPGDVSNPLKVKLVQWANSSLVFQDADVGAFKHAQGFAPGQQPDLDNFASFRNAPDIYRFWDEDCPS
jgi:hypothetical protein